MSGDNSASARAKRAQLEAELAEAQQELSDTYYDRSVSNQQDALDKELEDFREEKDTEMESWDEYLQNTNQVVADCLATVQENTETVYNTLQALGEEYGLSITESLTSPWAAGEDAIDSFTERFGDSMSATVDELRELEVGFIETMANIELAGKNAAQTVKDNFKGYTEAEKQPEQSGGGDNAGNGGGNSGGNGGSSNAGMVSGLSGNIQYGQSGDAVKKLQQALNDLGFNCGNVDGIFGSKTLAAVKQFQQSSKYGGAITADGIVGANTKKKFKTAGYASGTTGVKNDQWALIDELGLEELVMHAGPNGRLQYLTKGSAVIPHDISENLMEFGQLDPSAILDRNRPVISTHPEIHQTEINLNISYGDVLHIDEYNGGKPEDLTKIIAKEFDKHLKNVNQHIRRYSK